jgi:hypothetical protein
VIKQSKQEVTKQSKQETKQGKQEANTKLEMTKQRSKQTRDDQANQTSGEQAKQTSGEQAMQTRGDKQTNKEIKQEMLYTAMQCYVECYMMLCHPFSVSASLSYISLVSLACILHLS